MFVVSSWVKNDPLFQIGCSRTQCTFSCSRGLVPNLGFWSSCCKLHGNPVSHGCELYECLTCEEVPLCQFFSEFVWNEVTRLSVVQLSTEDALSAQIKEAQHCSIPGCLHLERRCLHLCHGWLRGADQWVYRRPPWWWRGPQYRRGRPAARAFWNDWQLRGPNQQSALWVDVGLFTCISFLK